MKDKTRLELYLVILQRQQQQQSIQSQALLGLLILLSLSFFSICERRQKRGQSLCVKERDREWLRKGRERERDSENKYEMIEEEE